MLVRQPKKSPNRRTNADQGNQHEYKAKEILWQQHFYANRRVDDNTPSTPTLYAEDAGQSCASLSTNGSLLAQRCAACIAQSNC